MNYIQLNITKERQYKLKRINIFSLLLITINLFTSTIVKADDTSIFTDIDVASGVCAIDTEKYRFIFIVDNSGSMNATEFTQSKSTIDATIDYVLNSGLNDVQVAVMQYGTNNNWPRDHAYDVTVPFTNNLATATNWGRQFGSGTSNPNYFQDHLPGSLAEARLDSIYTSGGALDVTDATNVQFVFFTDAWRSWAPWPGNGFQYCCSQLYTNPNDNFRRNSLNGFEEYNRLKDGSVIINSAGEGIRAQFTVLNTNTDGASQAAAAAIASPGGGWSGNVEANAGDPEGSGSRPRRYIQGSFAQSDTTQLVALVAEVIEEIKTTAFTQAAPAVTINAFNQLINRSELYYSFFQPLQSPRWPGNVKGYTFDRDVAGKLRDKNNAVAIDPATASIAPTALSYWSDGPYPQCDGADGLRGCENLSDGSEASVGAFSENLPATRTVYTQQRVLETVAASGNYYGGGILQVAGATPIDTALLGNVSTGASGSSDVLDVQFTVLTGDGNLVDNRSLEYDLPSTTLIFDDTGSTATGWQATAISDDLSNLGVDLNQEYIYEFTFGRDGTVNSGVDRIVMGLQVAADTAADSHRDDMTIGIFFKTNGRIDLRNHGTRISQNLTTYNEDDEFQVVVNGTNITINKNGSPLNYGTYTWRDHNNNPITAGIDYRAKAVARQDGTAATPMYFNNMVLRQTGIGGSVGTGGISRTDLLNWLIGRDVNNENLYSNVANANQFVADSLHSRPAVITYGGTSTAFRDVLFHTSNLGQLHAIDPGSAAAGGRELWAYVPPRLLKNTYDYLRNDDTIKTHTYGLDGGMSSWVERDPPNPGSTTIKAPKQVFMYMGQRRGGRGIYAFNATNAAKDISGFTLPSGAKTCGTYGDGAATDPICLLFKPIIGGVTPGFDQLGQTWSTPISNIQVNSCSGAVCSDRDVVIFSGGYDTDYDVTTNPSSLAGSVLGNHIYMVDAITGDLIWSAGRQNPGVTGDVFLSCDGVNTTYCADNMEHSFVAAPIAVDFDFDGTIDTLFAIDVMGQIWRFDFRADANDNRIYQNASGGIIARLNTSGSDRYFYNPLDIALIAEDENTARINITVASGRRPQPRLQENQANGIYAVYDYNIGNPPRGSGTAGNAPFTNSYKYDLTGTPSVITYDSLGVLDINDSDAVKLAAVQDDQGFRMDVDARYEKFLSGTLTKNSRIAAVSYLPENSLNRNDCGYGQNNLYIINLLTGELSETTLIQTGIAPEPVVITSLSDDPNCIGAECIVQDICIGTECLEPVNNPIIDPCGDSGASVSSLLCSKIGVPIKTKWFETGKDGVTRHN